MSRGVRESEWLATRRCLAIIRRLQREPTGWKDLVRAVLEAEGPEAYGQTKDQPLYKRFRNDIGRIRDRLRIDIRANRREYAIYDGDRPLLDLPDQDLTAIAWLEQNFHPNSPKYREVQDFLRRLRSFLAPTRRAFIERHRNGLVIDLGQRDQDKIDPHVETGLEQALSRRRRVEFDYYSPRNPGDQPRRHIVDIYDPVYFDTERGHYYVYGWCHYAVTPTGQDVVEDYITYRLGRIRNLRLLPNKLPGAPPPPKLYPVQYWLAPDIARGGVTPRRWINIDRIETAPDKGVIVFGATPQPFWAIQELMHYRHKCRVLGGPIVLDLIQETVEKMANLYKFEP